jgi:asparagine synthase (glutamine-hydrolysing)
VCGVAGLFDFKHNPVDAEVLEAMCRAMWHRGPDDGGRYQDRHVGLGHRRLSIIDLSSGHQPMSNEDDSVWIIFNGEIYNYQEIREDLLAHGHRFKTNSDTEVILHLYEDLQQGVVNKLRGMFAFAIWDRRKGSVFIARDRLGIKPLYYAIVGNTFAFASDIRALLVVPGMQRRVNFQALHDYLTFGYCLAPDSLFAGIRKLEPGHHLSVSENGVKEECYWDLDFSKKLSLPEEELSAEFRQRFQSVTQSHLMGEVPLGVLLSGGLDSTAVTAIVSELADTRVKTFSVGFAGGQGAWHDELPYARLAARHYNTEHHEIELTPKQFADGLSDYVWHMEEPMADPSSIPLYFVSKLAKGYVTIILSGEGSDELFGGYTFWSHFKGIQRALWFRRIPAGLRRYVVEPLNSHLLHSARLARYLQLAALPATHYFLVEPAFMANVFSEESKHQLYRSGARGTDGLTPSRDKAIEAYRKATRYDFLDQMLYVYSKQWLPDHTLVKCDKMTMAHSLELRVPFLDHSFVEFAASLPVDMKVHPDGAGEFTTKYLFRKAFEKRIPPAIIQRGKLGFPVPLDLLFKSQLTDMLADLLMSRSFRQSGVFDVDAVSAKLLHDPAGSPGAWSFLVLALWMDLYQVTQ